MKIDEVKKYEETNEIINGLLEEDETLWIVQGSKGRKVFIVDTEEEARDRYAQLPKRTYSTLSGD